MFKVVAVIPARFGATRFPGKPLAPILGKPMLQWVIEGVSQSKKLSSVVVATDDERIFNLSKSLNIECVMTGDLPTGSDRVWEAIKNDSFDYVINIQGDEPLIKGIVIDELIESIEREPGYPVYTLSRPLDSESLGSENTAKIVLNKNSEAIYFSRFPIPYSRKKSQTANGFLSQKHIGLYAYKKDFLGEFCSYGVTELEQLEGLEQLRVLQMGKKIKVVPVDYESWGVDLASDVLKIEEILRGRNGKV